MGKSKAPNVKPPEPRNDQASGRLSGRRLVVAALMVVNALLWGGILLSHHGVRGYLEKRRETLRMEARFHRLAWDNQRLFAKIKRFKKDPWFREKRVREELGWIRDGEIVFEFPPGVDGEKPVGNK